jgi:hypothetical protein
LGCLRSCTHLADADACRRCKHHRRKQPDNPVEDPHVRLARYAKQRSTEIDPRRSAPLLRDLVDRSRVFSTKPGSILRELRSRKQRQRGRRSGRFFSGTDGISCPLIHLSPKHQVNFPSGRRVYPGRQKTGEDGTGTLRQKTGDILFTHLFSEPMPSSVKIGGCLCLTAGFVVIVLRTRRFRRSVILTDPSAWQLRIFTKNIDTSFTVSCYPYCRYR